MSDVIEIDFGYKYNQMTLEELVKEYQIRELEIRDFSVQLKRANQMMAKLVKDKELMETILLTKHGVTTD